MLEWLRLKFDLQLFSEDDPDGGGDDNTDGDEGSRAKGDDTGSKGNDGQKLSQSEVDKAIEKRLTRARKQWEKEQEEKAAKDKMTAEERLKAEKEEAERKAVEREKAANSRAIKAEAKSLAASLGVKPERIDYAVRLADLSGVDVDDDGEPDTREIKLALEAVLKDLPELKGDGKVTVGSPSNPGGGSGVKANMNDLIRRRAGR